MRYTILTTELRICRSIINVKTIALDLSLRFIIDVIILRSMSTKRAVLNIINPSYLCINCSVDESYRKLNHNAPKLL